MRLRTFRESSESSEIRPNRPTDSERLRTAPSGFERLREASGAFELPLTSSNGLERRRTLDNDRQIEPSRNFAPILLGLIWAPSSSGATASGKCCTCSDATKELRPASLRPRELEGGSGTKRLEWRPESRFEGRGFQFHLALLLAMKLAVLQEPANRRASFQCQSSTRAPSMSSLRERERKREGGNEKGN